MQLKNGWNRLKEGITWYDFIMNFACPLILLGLTLGRHRFLNWDPCGKMDWASIVLVDAFVAFLLGLAALKMPKLIPERKIALLTIPALFAVLVLSFADLYVISKDVGIAKNNTIEILSEPDDAAYFSLVTITTLGYGDYAPQGKAGRKLVSYELMSGALLLFLAFPVLGSRLAQFDAGTGTGSAK